MPDDLENKPATRTLRSKKSVLLVSEKMDNCKVVIEKLKSDFVNTVRHAKIGRKRRRVESEDEAVIGEEEQEKEENSTAKGMRSSSSSGHTETRTFEKKETQKPSDRTQDERRSDEVNIKKAMPARTSPDENEFRRFPGKSESLPYPSSHGSSPKMTQHKLSSDELPEKKSRVDEAYEREREMERLKYEKEEEYLQMQKQKQRMSMFKKLENEMGGTFHKQQKTSEGSERRGNLSREEEKMENRSESGRDMLKHRSQEPSTSTAKEINHSFEAENSRSGSSSDHGSPRSQVIKSQSLCMSTTDTHERLQKLKESTEKEAHHSSVPSKDDRVRNRGTSSEQKISPKASSRSSDFKGESNTLHNHPSIVANNLAISRMAGHVDVLTEEEIMRRQRLAADHMGFYSIIGQFDPAFAPSMIQSSPQHMSRGVEHYMTKRH